MSNSFVIGVDSSTTSCKAIAWDRRGRALAEGRASFQLLSPQLGWYEQDAERWWDGLACALRDLGTQLDLSRAEAICLTHQRETFVPVDRNGCPIRNAITWMDERSRPQLADVERRIGKEHFHRISGKPLSVTVSMTKMLWLQQHEPDILRRAHKILDVHAFLVHRMTGHYRTSPACADPTGLLDMRSGTWSHEIVEASGLREDQLSELVPVGQEIGRVTAEAAAATGLPQGLPVIAGLGDGQSAGLGANITTPDRAYLNLGTCIIGGFFSPTYVCDLAFRTMNAPLPGAYFLEHALKGGVFTISWFVEKFAHDLRQTNLPLVPEEILEAAAAKLPPGSAGLVLVPYWNNVMNPYWDPAATGIVIGWTGAHGREHFYRAILEGIAFEQRLAGDAVMKATGVQLHEYITMGGGSKSALWCQIMADVTHVPVVRAETAEATCLGAGILAAAAAGWYPDIQTAAAAMTRTGRRFDPRPEVGAQYDKLYSDVYVHLFPAIRPYVDRLTELTRDE
ncbi:MAG: FGGY-family carbohydrate kinase [Anaerolineae bacterium]|nr:FGGY-family carbohydrate kinase [Candidatus Roseilinea sp.]MDW8450049.1 FGGY-family carbohydrate kinase [Anaerolineae bacterium]